MYSIIKLHDLKTKSSYSNKKLHNFKHHTLQESKLYKINSNKKINKLSTSNNSIET